MGYSHKIIEIVIIIINMKYLATSVLELIQCIRLKGLQWKIFIFELDLVEFPDFESAIFF